jgi:hypothetical protein
MPQLILEPTSTAQWQALVSEAAASCECRLDETIESYLVFLLMRFTARPELANRVLALEYLQGVTASGTLQVEKLRDVGDQCLLYSGLYPRQAERRLVRVSYFVGLGRAAYGQLAERLRHATADMYAGLAEAFVVMMDVLQAMRAFGTGSPTTPLEALELWKDTRSERALKILQAATEAWPLWHSDSDRSH